MTVESKYYRARRSQPISVVLALALLLSLQGPALAGTVEIVGQGTISYESRKPKPKDIAKAMEAAKKNVLDTYAGELPTSQRKNYRSIEEKLKSEIGSYVKGPFLKLEEDIDKDAKTYTVYIRANVDVVAIDLAIQDFAGGGDSAEPEYILFTFAARSQAEIKDFDDKRTKVRKIDATDDVQETTAADGQSIVSGTARQASVVTQSGGSTVRKEAKINYRVFSSAAVDSAVTQVFNEANFQVVPIFEIEPQIEVLFKEDFSQGDDVSGETRKYATDVTRDNEIPFFAYGLLTVELSRIDEATGQTVVGVQVIGKVFDLKRRFAKNVASVGPVVYRGFGASPTEAQANALKNAARSAASELTQQLMSKGIR